MMFVLARNFKRPVHCRFHDCTTKTDKERNKKSASVFQKNCRKIQTFWKGEEANPTSNFQKHNEELANYWKGEKAKAENIVACIAATPVTLLIVFAIAAYCK